MSDVGLQVYPTINGRKSVEWTLRVSLLVLLVLLPEWLFEVIAVWTLMMIVISFVSFVILVFLLWHYRSGRVGPLMLLLLLFLVLVLVLVLVLSLTSGRRFCMDANYGNRNR